MSAHVSLPSRALASHSETRHSEDQALTLCISAAGPYSLAIMLFSDCNNKAHIHAVAMTIVTTVASPGMTGDTDVVVECNLIELIEKGYRDLVECNLNDLIKKKPT